MSQVIVTNDKLKAKRERSKDQERKIDRESHLQKWRRSDATQTDPFQKLVGYAVLPIVALWGILCGVMALVVTAVNYLFKALGQLFNGRNTPAAQ